MKKILSILAAAMLTLAVGCGNNWEKCSDAKNESDCQKEANFKDKKKCTWDKTVKPEVCKDAATS